MGAPDTATIATQERATATASRAWTKRRMAALGAWLNRADVRVALIGMLALRVAYTLVGIVVAWGGRPAFVAVTRDDNLHGARIGERIIAAPTSGWSLYLATPWLRWDANHYLSIAEVGYSYPGSTAFPPLYPLLIRLLSYPLGGSTLLSALALSTVATGWMLLSLYRLTLRISASAAVARWSVIVACLLPIAFFFMAPYSESLFIGLSLAAMLAALDQRWRYAALLAVAATLTRQQGALLGLLAAPLLWTLTRVALAERAPLLARLHSWWGRARGPLLLAVCPAVIYLVWLASIHFLLRAATPYELLTAQNAWNERFVVPGYGLVVDALFVLRHPPVYIIAYLNLPLDMGAGLLALTGLALAWRRLPRGIALYLAAAWALALSKVDTLGIPVSSGRYLMALLPLCLVPAVWLARPRPGLRLAYVSLCALCGVIYFAEFMFWRWLE